MDEALKPKLRALIAIHLIGLVALGPLGCAHRLPAPVAAPPDKPETGTVTLAVSSASPGGWFQPPAVTGAGEGAKKGAKTGAIVPLLPGVVVIKEGIPDARILMLGLGMLGAGLVLAPVGAGVGATVGAFAASSADEVEQTTARLRQALADANLPEALSTGIVEGASDRPIIASSAASDVVTDTVLEIDSVAVTLSSKDPTDWRPNLKLRLAISGRLIRVSDREELRSWRWEHEGAEARFLEWGKDDARRFREELARAARALTAKVVADVF